MARNIQIREPGNNYADVLHPETNSGMVLMENGSTLQEDLDTYKADIANKTDAAKGAALIGMKPITGLTGDNVREAISNLFTFANDGKTGIANAVTAKGVAASPSDTFATLATKIGQISTGKKFASGSFSAPYTNDRWSVDVNITGLDFTPREILIYTASYTNYENRATRSFKRYSQALATIKVANNTLLNTFSYSAVTASGTDITVYSGLGNYGTPWSVGYGYFNTVFGFPLKAKGGTNLTIYWEAHE
jgi:hypothetical protein